MPSTPVASLRARLTLGLGALAGLVLVVSIVALVALTRLGGAVGTILQENYTSVVAATAMHESLERLDDAALLLATGQPALAGPLLDRHRPLFAAALEREAAIVTLPGEGALVERVRGDYAEYVAATDRVARAGRRDAGDYFAELLPRSDRVRASVQAIRALNQTAMEAADQRARRVAHDAARAALAVAVAAALLAATIALRLSRSIVPPVAALRDGAVRIGEGLASGDLPDSVPVPPLAELAPLAESLNALLARLRAYRESSLGELLAAQDLARSTIACLLDPVVVVGAEGSVLLANEAAERAFGLREGTAAELLAAAIAVPDPLLAAVADARRLGHPVLPGSLAQAMHHVSPAGERFFLVRAAPLPDRGPDRGRCLVVAQDVTRFRRIDELKSNVVATVSHEFKTPLTSLRMATHLLLEPAIGPLSDSQRELVTTARDDTERLRLLVEKFLDLARIEAEAGEMVRTAVLPRHLLASVVEGHRTVAAARSIALSSRAPDDLPSVWLDPDKMAMALSNLVANALQHSA
ncbi:MAG: HAMP domain-containing sensor histidine kinase, partial [Myxococcales bacterium]